MLYDWSMVSNYITGKWRRISQSEIRNSAAAESEGGAGIHFPHTPFSARPARAIGFLAREARQLVQFKKGSREVYNYSTKTNFVGIDCSARRVRRAPQGKIRFCFRRKIPEFAPITI
jgi:hypothetical protein